jgi:hypothetical protein
VQHPGEIFLDGKRIAIVAVLLNRGSSDLFVRIGSLLLSVFVLQSESVPNKLLLVSGFDTNTGNANPVPHMKLVLSKDER